MTLDDTEKKTNGSGDTSSSKMSMCQRSFRFQTSPDDDTELYNPNL